MAQTAQTQKINECEILSNELKTITEASKEKTKEIKALYLRVYALVPVPKRGKAFEKLHSKIVKQFENIVLLEQYDRDTLEDLNSLYLNIRKISKLL